MTQPALLDIVSSAEGTFYGGLSADDRVTWVAWRAFEGACATGTVDELMAAAYAYMEMSPAHRIETACVLGAFLLARGKAREALPVFSLAVENLLGAADYQPTIINALIGRAAAHLADGRAHAAVADAAAAAEMHFAQPDFYVGDSNPFGGPGWFAQMIPTYPISATLRELKALEDFATPALRGRLIFMEYVATGAENQILLRAAQKLLGDDPLLRDFQELNNGI